MKEEILRFSFRRTGVHPVREQVFPHFFCRRQLLNRERCPLSFEDGPADFTELLKGVKRIFTNEREKPLTLLF